MSRIDSLAQSIWYIETAVSYLLHSIYSESKKEIIVFNGNSRVFLNFVFGYSKSWYAMHELRGSGSKQLPLVTLFKYLLLFFVRFAFIRPFSVEPKSLAYLY